VKLKKIGLAIGVIALLCSCSGGHSDSKNNIKMSLTTANETLKGFETKGSLALLSNDNMAAPHRQALSILIGNYDDVRMSGFAVGKPPKGKAVIVITIKGKKGKDGQPKPALTVGTISNSAKDASEPTFTVNVIDSSWSNGMLSGAPYMATKDMQGTVELTELSETHAKGKLTYAEADKARLTVDFDVEIEKK